MLFECVTCCESVEGFVEACEGLCEGLCECEKGCRSV